MKLELYYYDECYFCQSVLQTIDRLGLQEKVVLKNKLRNREYAEELQQLIGHMQVPCLIIDGKPMLESGEISQFLESQFG